PDATLLILDERSSLFRLREAGWHESTDGTVSKTGTAQIVATGVLAIARVGSDIVYVGKEWLAKLVAINRIGDRPSVLNLDVESNFTDAHFGFGGSLANEVCGLLAVGRQREHYSVFTSSGTVEIDVPDEYLTKGVGRLYRSTERKNEPVLIGEGGDFKTVVAIGAKREEVLFTASELIRNIALSSATPYLAYATMGGEVSVYSLIHRRTLCSFKPGDVE
ncbi:MAG TPA: hypothetical protein VEZ90_01205, partial [Blastocatellia bacterium]|nr:hypothetical protein [Blastocatellia bacterium]